MNYLGIDAGASATKWALVDEKGVTASGVQEAMDGHLYRESSLLRMQKVLGEIASAIQGKKVNSIYMGITGVTQDGSIQNAIRAVFNCDSTVVSDIELAYRANFTAGEGILLYAGTGSVSFAIDEKREIHQVGGWGYLLGDEGAGYWIGKEAIRNALFQIETGGGITSGSLADLILREINAHDWNTVKTFVYSKDRASIAALSKVVNTSAIAGDMEALQILKDAAKHLADLVERMDKQLTRDSLSVKFTGGISHSDYLCDELKKILGMRVSTSTVDIALRAAELAR
jgi:N-acetylglucosamine kinase-like BadF-type ATPase